MIKVFSAKRIADSGPVTMGVGEVVDVWVEFLNTGHEPWDNKTKLAAYNPRDRSCAFATPSWSADSRPCRVDRLVPPGDKYRFCFTIKAPFIGPSDTIEHFTLVQEGVKWFDQTTDSTFPLRIKVVRGISLIKRPKLLYLSCHQELEADEVTTFRNLGYEVFPVGFYTYGSHKTDSTLRIIPGNNHPEFQEKFDYYFKKDFKTGWPNKLNKDFIQDFDVIVNAHFLENLNLNWSNGLSEKFVIHRTIGQGDGNYENALKKYFQLGVPFVRMCATEHLMPGFCGKTNLIRTTIDDNFFSGWNGSKEQVLTIQKWMARGAGRMLPEYERITAKFDGKRILAGRENGKLSFGRGDVPTDELQKLRQDSRVYFSVASRKAPLTYTIVEAMMTGMPVVSVGKKLAGYEWFEPPSFIENGVNGFYSDSEAQCTEYIDILMNDVELGRKIGEAGRQTMQSIFSPHIIQAQWRDFLNGYGV